MQNLFKTFKPKNPIVKKYVDYYYLDIKPKNTVSTFQCFPHYNNSLSLYKSHSLQKIGEVVYKQTAKPLQIFTPIRKKVLTVKQTGNVYRIVIVFYPLGVQQFYKHLNFTNYITNTHFFTDNELNTLFSTTNTTRLTTLIDRFLEQRYHSFTHSVLEKSIPYIFKHYEHFSVSKMSTHIGISRQHLNRVFKLHLGVSVKKFNNIVLFRKTIKKKLYEKPESSFTELAHEFNFNDQSHFIKTYKNLTGKSPTLFFKKGTVLGKEDTFWHLLP